MFIAKKSLLRISEMLFVFLRLVEIIETEFISTTQKKEKKIFKDSAFKVCKHKGQCESLQLNLGLKAEGRHELASC